jgi:endopeptidase La
MSNKKFKIYLLKKEYEEITEILNTIETHIIRLNNNNMINSQKYNKLLENVFNIIKELNNQYNNEINVLSSSLFEIDNIIINDINNTSQKFLLDCYKDNFECYFFVDIKKELIKIICDYGYYDILSLLKLFDNTIKLSKEQYALINEINNITIPISINTYNVEREDNYYWRFPTEYNENDLLEKKRELWIKMNNTINKNTSCQTFIKIELIFKIDFLSNKVKTSQLNSQIYFNKKNTVLEKLNEMNIDTKFIRVFIRHDYLGNFYCMNNNDYIEYLIDINKKYENYQNSNFISIMNKFVNTDNKVRDIHQIILILLLGNEDMVNIAGLLVGLIKEKKSNSNIYNYIYNNLTFYLQSKIRNNTSNIKNNIDKIKSINVAEIDYKKQLMLNNDIPANIKTMALEKAEEMKSNNNEYYKQITYVKTIINYPWKSNDGDYVMYNKDKQLAKSYLLDIEDKLKNTCYGHQNSKKLLLQTIAKWISNPLESNGTCFGMVGPPGVGKTLLAKSISKVLNIPFAQITLGGQNDGELLHGHGYTYSGAQPGMIVKKMTEMGNARCILYFDELDKACSKNGSTNEIMSILIHLTDPNMNKSFQDRFFQGVDFPLDKVIFMFSYNDSSLVDPILLDRLTEIEVEPYTIEDKLKICNNYILPEMCENIGIDNKVFISDDNIKYLIESYTAEAGVRGIKRQFEKILLQLNIDKIYQKGIFKSNQDKKIIINKKIITDILKPPTIERLMISDKSRVGIINGLYATKGGDGGITPIQVFLNTEQSCNNYEIKLTGKQGDMMKESVYCSLTTAIEYLKENHKKYNIDNLDEHFKNNIKHGFHIHAPSAATPKDGPSAGCAFTSAFISRILNRPIKNNIAMTGEIELTGKISKIGGLEFKLNGAKKAGVNTVYVPQENSNDVDKIKKKYKKLFDDSFRVVIVNNIRNLIDDILL